MHLKLAGLLKKAIGLSDFQFHTNLYTFFCKLPLA